MTKSRGLTRYTIKEISEEDNFDLCIEGCSLDHGGREPLDAEEEDREGFFNTILTGAGRFTDETDLSPSRIR